MQLQNANTRLNKRMELFEQKKRQKPRAYPLAIDMSPSCNHDSTAIQPRFNHEAVFVWFYWQLFEKHSMDTLIGIQVNVLIGTFASYGLIT